jgi:hypothetical protein
MSTEPDHVWIGSHRFSIEYGQDYFLSLVRAGGSDRFGESNMASMTIRVSDARSFTGMQETLLHEILHCLIWQAGIDIPEDPEKNCHEREEKLVGQMSGILLDCLKRNPFVFEWLMRDEFDAG